MNHAPTLKLSHKGLILVLIPLVCGLTFFAFLYTALTDAEATARKERRSRILGEQSTDLSLGWFDATRYQYELYRHGSEDEVYRRKQEGKFKAALRKLRAQFTTMHAEIADEPEEDAALSNLQREEMIPLIRADQQRLEGERDQVQLMLLMMAEAKVLPKIARDVDILTKHYIEEEESAFQLQVRHRLELKQWLRLAGVISIVLSLGLYVYFTRDTSNRLARLLDNTVRFANKQSLHPPLQGDDEISRLDMTFRQMAQSITEAANQKQEFMTMLARHLRFPLDAINQALQRMSERRLVLGVSEMSAGVVQRCLDSSAALMRLVDDLFDVESAESGKLEMKFQQVPISSVLDRAIRALHGLVEAKSIKIIIPTTEFSVYADGDRLVQVSINLLANAVKFSPATSHVKVEIIERDPWLMVRIVDNGPGISRENQAHVFERYHQIGTSERRSSGGTGLGLTICKEIIDAHNGTIGVDSKEGMGCAFWFEVPMTQAAMNSRTGKDTSSPVKDTELQKSVRATNKNSRFSLSLPQKGLILLGVPLAFGITCLGLLYGALFQAEMIARDEALAKSFNDHKNMLFQRTIEATTTFMQTTQGDADHLAAFKTAVKSMHDELTKLHDLAANDRVKDELLTRFESSIMERFDRIDQARAHPQMSDMPELLTVSFNFDKLRPFLEPYRRMAESSFQRQATDIRLLKDGLLGAIAINIFLSLVLYVTFTRDTSSRLDRVLDNTLRFARGESLNPQLAGNDEIARLDRVFHDMAEAITRAADEKKEFMAMIAHDLRSPLTSMCTSLMLLSEERTRADLSAEAQSIVDSCIESSERVLQLINDLLDAEKLDAGKLQMHFEELPIAHVLETATRAVRQLAEKRHVTLEVPSSDSEVRGDPERLVQVLVNLLASAVENASEGTTVTVQLEDEEVWLVLRVKDTIAATGSPRTSLSSSICKQIVTAHHGTMGVEETDGVNRTIWMRLPRAGHPVHT